MTDNRETEGFEPWTEAEEEELRQKLQASFDNVRLSDDAKSAMLANLMAAADARTAGSVDAEGMQSAQPQTAQSQPVDLDRARRNAANRRGRRLRILLPVAACLLVVVVAGGVAGRTLLAPHGSMTAEVAYESVDESASSVSESEAVTEPGMVLEESDAAAEAGVSDWAALYPVIELEDGTRLRITEGDVPAVDVEDSVEATAISEDGLSTTTCWVCAAGDGSYAVTFDYEEFFVAVVE